MASMGKAMMGTGESEGEGRAMKAAEMAISNPLIDDYTLKGAKGLLVNITGGQDLKLFEVDEVVNKIRAEVDSEAEVIIGAITDETLDGKIRVSIVATSLDGQQPEAKSVINMVHRIQNRNPGYSNFSNTGSSQTFNFSTTNSNSITSGANALKLENEVLSETADTNESSSLIQSTNNEYNEELLNNQKNEIKNSTEGGEISAYEQSFLEKEPDSLNEIEQPANEIEQPTNGLENFGIENESPNLFNSDNDSLIEEVSENNDEKLDDDDLEIPAFLRRQKN